MAECSDHPLSTNTQDEDGIDCANTSQSAANTSARDDSIATGQKDNNLKVITQAENGQTSQEFAQFKSDTGNYILVVHVGPEQELQQGNAETGRNDKNLLGRAENQQCRGPAKSELQEKHDPAEAGQAAGDDIGDQTKPTYDEAAIKQGKVTRIVAEPANTSSSKPQKSSSSIASMCVPPYILPRTPTEPNTVRI